MKCYEDKCHILLNADETLQENIGTSHINNSKCKKLLGIKIDCKLSFDDHIEYICKNASANPLIRVAQYMKTEKSA